MKTSTCRRPSDNRLTCYVVVVAVVVDNHEPWFQRVVTPVVFPLPSSIVSRNRPSFDPDKIAPLFFFLLPLSSFRASIYFCPLRCKRDRRPIRICSKQSRRFLSSVAQPFFRNQV